MVEQHRDKVVSQLVLCKIDLRDWKERVASGRVKPEHGNLHISIASTRVAGLQRLLNIIDGVPAFSDDELNGGSVRAL